MENKQPQIIKKVEPVHCPHCDGMVYIDMQTMMPAILGMFTNKDIEEAKEQMKNGLKEIKFADEKERENIVAWIDDKNNLLSRSDVSPLLKQVAIEQLEKVQKMSKK